MPDGAEWQAPPIDPPRLAEYFRQVESFQAERARRARRSARLAWGLFGAAMLAVVAQSWSIAAMLPLKHLVPLYLWVRPDGTVDNATSMSDLPATQSAAVIRSAIWQYVRNREGYDFADARYRYDLVSLMSAPAVRDQYQHWFLAHTNPQSPQVTVGRKGQINTALINMSFVRPRVALVRYRRTVQMYGEQVPSATTWTSTVGFDVAGQLPAKARLADPGGVVITNYQNSEDTPQ